MGKRVIIVHCWDGYPDYAWYPKTKKELEKLGFKVEVPSMPESNLPKLSLWLPKLQEIIGIPDKDLYLVGHSSGCITILRYLETLSVEQCIGGVILVAGFTDDLGYKELKNFFATPINFEKIKQKAKEFIVIHSDNDPYVTLKYGDIFKAKIGAKLIIKHNMGHFSGELNDKAGVYFLPDVATEITKMAN